MNKPSALLLGPALLLACNITSVLAASGTWTGASNTTWGVNSNWTGASFPNAGIDTATFDGAGNGNTAVTLNNTAITLDSLVFDSAGAAAYTISGGGTNGILTLSSNNVATNADILVNGRVTNNQAVNAEVRFSGATGTKNLRNVSPTAALSLGGTVTPAAFAGNNTFVLQGNGRFLVPGSLQDNTTTNRAALAVRNSGTTILSGSNTLTHIVESGGTGFQIAVAGSAALVLDYASVAQVLNTNAGVIFGSRLSGTYGHNGVAAASLTVKGAGSGTTAQTLGLTYFPRGQTTIAVDRNGGSGTTLRLSPTWTNGSVNFLSYVAFDLSSGGAAALDGTNFSGGGYGVTNGTIMALAQAAVTVKGTNGLTYYATLDGSGNIVQQTNLTNFVSGAVNTGNYLLTDNITITNSPTRVNSLRIDPSGPGRSLSGSSISTTLPAVLMDGVHDYTLNNLAWLPSTQVGIIVTDRGGKLITTSGLGSGQVTKAGAGVFHLAGNSNSASSGPHLIAAGALRVQSNTITTGNVLLSGGVLELSGFDLIRPLGTNTGEVRWNGTDNGTVGLPGGFSAHGGDRFVNLGGASATLTFGVTPNFLASRDSKLMLSSAYADATIDFQNPLDLSADWQTVEVADGSAAVDAKLSGQLSNGSLAKTGPGALALTASNTLAGGFAVAAGTLRVDGSTDSGGRVAAGATLAGTGTVFGDLNVAGTLAPGGVTNRGIFSSSGTVTVSGTNVFRVASSSDHDALVAATAALNGTVRITFVAGYTPASGDSFDFVNAAITGNPALDLPDISTNSLAWVTNNFTTTGVLSITNSGSPGGYTAWLTNYPGLSNTNVTADPDNDGFNNGTEFVFDGNPTIGSPALMSAAKSGTNAVFRFAARQNATNSYIVFSTTNLATGPWTNAAVTVTNAGNQDGLLLPADYVRREFTVPAGGRLFLRVTGAP